MNFLLRNLDIAFVLLSLATCVALLLLESIRRKVNHMSTATDALTTALAELQASLASLETRLATPAPVIPSVDEEAVARAATTVAAIKTQVDGLAVPATPAA